MAVHDTFADIAALLNPMPTRADQEEDAYQEMAEAAWREREDLAEALRLSWEDQEADPLLLTLARLREQRLQLEADMRLLIAYGRCFTHPRPYKLIDLASAAGMSISGIRTAYDTDEIGQAAEILQRSPAAAGETTASDGEAAPAP